MTVKIVYICVWKLCDLLMHNNKILNTKKKFTDKRSNIKFTDNNRSNIKFTDNRSNIKFSDNKRSNIKFTDLLLLLLLSL